MKIKKLFSLLIIISFSFLIAISFVNAASDTVSGLLDGAGKKALYDTSKNNITNVPLLIGGVLKMFITLLGVIFLGLLIYAGYLWMTARGDATQADKSKTIMTQAVIGLLITVAAYAISYFVLYMLATPVMQGGGGF